MISSSLCSAVSGARSNTMTGQPGGSHPLSRAVKTMSSRPLPLASSDAEHLGGGWVEPLHILGDHQPRAIAEAGQQVAADRL